MKVAIRAGHTFSVPGARAILDETTETRKVKDAIVKYLKKANHSVLDVTPNDSYNTVSKEISYGVNSANNWGADLFLSIHFNKAYTNYNGAIGTEVLVYEDSRSNSEAKAVLKALVSLGFKNRGVKERKDLGELRSTRMTSMIVEVCFVEATDDVALYRNLGYDKVGLAIAEALSGKIGQDPVKPVEPTKPEPEKPKPETPSGNWIVDLQKELNRSYNAGLIVDGLSGPKTLSACPLLKNGSSGEIVRILQRRLGEVGCPCGTTGIDGQFGHNTEVAVLKLQGMKGLVGDGVVGNKTWASLMDYKVEESEPNNNWITDLQRELNRSYNANLTVDGLSGPKTLGACPLLKDGSRGEIVKILQNRLISLGYPCGIYGTDGSFGNSTKNAVVNYQKSKGLSADGIVGNNTWKKLLNL